MVTLREIVMIHDLHRQGLGISAIARQTGLDRKTVRKYLKQRLQTPRYGPWQPRPRLLDPYEGYLRERVAAYPGLSARRLWREIAELGYTGGYTTLTDFLREVRRPAYTGFEHRFETPPGKQAQADFAHFKVSFEDEHVAAQAPTLQLALDLLDRADIHGVAGKDPVEHRQPVAGHRQTHRELRGVVAAVLRLAAPAQHAIATTVLCRTILRFVLVVDLEVQRGVGRGTRRPPVERLKVAERD